MTTFNPSVLVPTATVPALAKAQSGKSIKATALDAIKKQIELVKNPKAEGRRTSRVVGDQAAFSIRVANKPLVLATATNGPAKSDVTELACPVRFLEQGFAHFVDRIAAGEFDAQLEQIATARDARAEKMRTTRAAKPKSK